MDNISYKLVINDAEFQGALAVRRQGFIGEQGNSLGVSANSRA